MKNIIFVVLIAGGYCFCLNQGVFEPTDEVKTLGDIHTKLQSSPVNSDEILIGASELALRLCHDNHFQELVGENVNSCQYRFNKLKPICAEHIFGKQTIEYSSKDRVSSLASRFVKCVST